VTYDNASWQRPGPGGEEPGGPADPGPAAPEPGYAGPPPTQPPPAGWRPPTYAQSPPPRQLAPQDIDKIEAQEKDARTLTYGVGLVAAAVLVVLSCLLCSRVLF
jgi:hypothetical protein